MTPSANDTALSLQITGMHCAGCVGSVESAILRVPGVVSAAVNLATESAAILVRAGDDADAVAARVADAVRSAGFGARSVTSPTDAAQTRIAERRQHVRSLTMRLCIGLLLGLPVLSEHVVSAWSGQTHAHLGTTRLLLDAVLAMLVLVITAGPILVGAARSLASGTIGMDLLVSLGTLTAFGAGVIGLTTGRHELLLFDSAIMIVLFVAAGKLLEARARSRATAALAALSDRIPRNAIRIRGTQMETVPIEWIVPGDLLRVAAPSSIPVDGVVETGALAIDEALLTGESRLLVRESGARVLGGSVAREGLADIRASTTGSDSTAARIARLVEAAQAGKPQLQRLADRAAAWFTPVVLGAAALVFLTWLLAGAALDHALTRAIAVLVIACPCAMGLAIPTAVVVGTARGAEAGILICNVEALETLTRVNAALFDKTGTLTSATPQVKRFQRLTGDRSEPVLLSLASALARLSQHPLSNSIVTFAGDSRSDAPLSDFRNEPGAGLRAQIGPDRVQLGSRGFLASQGVEFSPDASSTSGEQDAVVWLAISGHAAGVFYFENTLDPAARGTLTRLKALGIRCEIISGDRREACERVAAELELPFEAELSPEDKLARVKAKSATHCVAMVGDGVNDAAALAAAHVGVAIGAGSDLAREAADVCLVGSSLAGLARAIELARKTVRTMRQNLYWAIGYNVLMLPAAAIAPIPPSWAAAAMMLSSFSVVANSLRIRAPIG